MPRVISPPPLLASRLRSSCRRPDSRRSTLTVAAATTLMSNSVPPKSGVLIVGDFMTKKEELHVVKPTTTVDEALKALVENRITGFPVIDDDWKLAKFVLCTSLENVTNLVPVAKFNGRGTKRVINAYHRDQIRNFFKVGVVSDYDLLALDSIAGTGRADTDMFPEVDSTWKTFNEIQNLLSKTNGKLVGDLMTPTPLVVRETTNLEDAARLLLETKYRRLPVVDGEGKLVGIITRGNVVRAALKIKKKTKGKGDST